MKINIFLTVISVLIAGLIAFGFFMANSGDVYRVLITIGAGISFFITLGGSIALSFPNGGSMNIKVVSGSFFIVLIISHIIFSFININMSAYIIVTGILLLFYITICYGIMRTLK